MGVAVGQFVGFVTAQDVLERAIGHQASVGEGESPVDQRLEGSGLVLRAKGTKPASR